MRTDTLLDNRQQNLPLLVGTLFLVGFWWIGFDGITFSDDVYYILAGKSFWEGTMEVNSYHFSSRWGAYIPAGLLGHFFGLDPHIISGFSLLCYLITLLVLYKVLPDKKWAWILTIWFCTHVYFLHFITKVYPDSSLVLWVTSIPVVACYRKEQPILAGIILVLALFVGFLTKETIIFFVPFVALLFLFDLKNKSIQSSFYSSVAASGLLLASLYLTYFWIQFGDPFYRITSINAGHYISEYTYADKGVGAIIERLTITPFSTFVERAYWPWLVFAIPGIYQGMKFQKSFNFEFALAFICLLLGFWLMSSTLEFYNPIYLNPRHLIILIPILSFLITLGWNYWQNSRVWKMALFSLMVLGIIISAIQGDAKQALFLCALIPVIWIKKRTVQLAILGIVLALPAIFSIYYQKQLKQYQNLTDTLTELSQSTDKEHIILTNNFIYFSREILLPESRVSPMKLFPIESLQELNRDLPKGIQVVIYEYYKHAYPKEQADVDLLESWLKMKNYQLESEEKIANLWIRKFQLATQ
ncbi:hypothetical protein V8V91_02355 [Algoriphagus halophilus]|uniref:ArnT family glycosyltransferase n=1 Tax=Algoriphagus halophilus TaxID=226505 RepID=UPI00358F8616